MVNSSDRLIYMHGGMSGQGVLGDFWALNVGELTWSRVAETKGSPRPCARAAHGAVSVGKAVYVFGGLHADGAALDDLWRYDTGSRLFYRINYFGVAHLIHLIIG